MITEAWAKLDRNRGLMLSVHDHGTDVAAVMAAFLEAGWDQRFGVLLEQPLPDIVRDALVATAFLHDMGKTNAGFWRRQFQIRQSSGTSRRCSPTAPVCQRC